jgi:hypothetical protein
MSTTSFDRTTESSSADDEMVAEWVDGVVMCAQAVVMERDSA